MSTITYFDQDLKNETDPEKGPVREEGRQGQDRSSEKALEEEKYRLTYLVGSNSKYDFTQLTSNEIIINSNYS